MSLKNKAILVTGGAGFIGSHLIDRLIKECPEKIIVVDNFFTGKMKNLEEAKSSFENLKIYNEDASEFTAIENIIAREGTDVVFNLATKPLPYSFINPEGAFMVNVNIVCVLLNLLKKGIYDRLIHFSSSEAYGSAEYVPMDEEHPLKPTTPYSAGKAASDLMVMSYYRTFGLDVSIVRPFNNYGPRQNDLFYAAVIPITIKRILNNERPIVEWDGNQTRDFIYVEDTVKATIDIYNSKISKGRIINIASGKETKIRDLIEVIKREMRCKDENIKKPKRQGDIRRHCGSVEIAKKLIDFNPQTSFDEGIRKTVGWYKDTNGK